MERVLYKHFNLLIRRTVVNSGTTLNYNLYFCMRKDLTRRIVTKVCDRLTRRECLRRYRSCNVVTQTFLRQCSLETFCTPVIWKGCDCSQNLITAKRQSVHYRNGDEHTYSLAPSPHLIRFRP